MSYYTIKKESELEHELKLKSDFCPNPAHLYKHYHKWCKICFSKEVEAEKRKKSKLK